MKKYLFVSFTLLLSACRGFSQEKQSKESVDCPMEKIVKSESEWQKILKPEQFYVTRKGGTERAFTGEYWDNHKKGAYHCSSCDLALFSSETKFESGTGWPSFWQPINACHVEEKTDISLGMERVEVLCRRCQAHLGHVFEDGPKPTGLRYCLNSVSLKFYPKKK